MMVTFVSQCEKKALKKTRRVLDAFANRIGDNTWQTLITEEGLATVKKMLRKTASKSTAVSCHWIRTRSRSQLLWIVGNKNKFNEEGIVPVNRTRRDLLKSEMENDWHYLPLIKSLTAISALLHDWGKASALFQEKLQPESNNKFKGDPLRHEWISLLLFRAFVLATEVKSDEDWLVRLSEGNINEQQLKATLQTSIQTPFSELPLIAQLVAWLVVSHHRLPGLYPKGNAKKGRTWNADTMGAILNRIEQEWGYENKFDEKEFNRRVTECFRFPKGLLNNASTWKQKLKRWAKQLLENKLQAEKCLQDGSYRSVLHHARLSLMLGDHNYSSKEANKSWRDTSGLYANTNRKTKQLNQTLDEHLVGVASYSMQVAHLLPAFEKEPPVAENIQALRKPSPKGYEWQDKAVTRIGQWQSENLREKTTKGFFAVNMASTGCGKTFANAKIMRALSQDQKSLRFILALGLRTLTLQTGREYRTRVGLDESELAVQIGSKAVMELEQAKNQKIEENSPEYTGSESTESLLDSDVDFDCAIPNELFTTILKEQRDKKFLYAPVLACTIDHLMSAVTTHRGGRYILPTLRLMSSDLVIDEIDDFTGDDLIAIGRLIHLAGMLGRKVMISSATIPPYMAEGYFNAYREGWALYCKGRDAKATIGCAWVDEFTTHLSQIEAGIIDDAIKGYRKQHAQFIQGRVDKLNQQPARRKAVVASCQAIMGQDKQALKNHETVQESKRKAYFDLAFQQARELHNAHYTKDQASGLKISFGVIRTANIEPCVALTKYLLERDYPENTDVRVMAYHSQQVLLMRSEQERYLDAILNRKQPEKVLQDTQVRKHIAQVHQHQPLVKNLLFILVATPVEEVGRDHDFDWAVVEPSSYRSIIQLAGRVKRHRLGAVEKPNVALMQYNLKGLQEKSDYEAVFIKPGFEESIRLKPHNLDALLDEEQIAECLDAIPRIQFPTQTKASTLRNTEEVNNLAELEHIATWKWLANYKSTGEEAQTGPNKLLGWLTQSWFLTGLPQVLVPFRAGKPTLSLFLVYDPAMEQNTFCEKDDEGLPIAVEQVNHIQREELSHQAMKRLWLERNFNALCQERAEEMGYNPRYISLRYGELNFPFDENKRYVYNDQLGLVKK